MTSGLDFQPGGYGVLRAIIEGTTDAVFAKDLQGRYVFVNSAFAAFLGKSKEDILGRRDAELYPPETAQRFVADDREVLRTGKTLAFEGVAPGTGGEQPYRVTKGVVRDGRGSPVGVFGISHDMTERRRAEQEKLARAEAEAARSAQDKLLGELRESEERYRSLLENANDIIYSHDLEGNYLTINRACEAITGYTREELLGGLNMAQVVAHEHLALAKRMMEQKLRDPSPTVYEIDIITKDGRRLTLEVSTRISRRGGRPVVEGIARDVTERKRVEAERQGLLERERIARADAERLLRESVKLAAVYRDLARSLELRDVTATICRAVREIVRADGATFIVREGEEVYYADEDAIAPLWKGRRFPATACLSGWAILERRPAAVEDVYSDDRIPVEAYRPTFVKSLLMVPVRAVSPVGAMGAYWADRHEATEDELRLMQALAHAADVAFANSQLYEQARRARLEAESANRLKDEFLATLSHELRTPLTAILGWAHMLEGGELDAETSRRALEVIRRQAEQQRTIVEDVLDASGMVTGKLRVEMGPAELIPLVEAACDAVRPAARAKGVEIRCHSDPDVGQVTGDPHRLQQIFWNLMSNAVKFTPPGGRVKVEVARLLTHARVEVSDTGQGIPADFLPFVFDRFRQADGSTTRQHGGLGLGLSIVRHLVEAHGGSVHAYSSGEGQGATFTVDLPLPVSGRPAPTAAGGAGQAAEPSDSARQVTTGAGFEGVPPLVGLRVLLVDDDRDTVEMLAALLRGEGAGVTTAASAGDALGALEAERPDVIVADIAMPGEDGYALIRKVRSLGAGRGGHTPAVALTAYAGEGDRALALRAGFQAHQTKPVEPGAFVELIANLAGRVAPSEL